MTTTFSHPIMPGDQIPSSLSTLKTILLEPLFVAAACLFWLAVLPVSGIFCATVAAYDKIASFKGSGLRLPDLRHNVGHNPLVLRKKSAPGPKTASQARGTARALQS